MLERQFTDDQRQFRDAYRRFLADEIAPHMEQWRENGIVDRAAFRKAGALGFLMIWPDEELGGLGDTDFRFEQIIIEEQHYALVADWFAPLHSRLVGPYFTRFGSPEQQRRFLPRCASGEHILAIAMTEPGTGSNVAGIKTTAVDDGDSFVLNGSKTYISNGINADIVIVAAKTGAAQSRDIGLFVVERGMPGFERGRMLKKMGNKAQDTAELFFENVVVPKSNVLGDPTQGFRYLMEGLAEERLIGAVGFLAAAQKAFDLTVEFVSDRKVFGKSVSEFQNTQFKLADLRTKLDIQQVYVDQQVAALNAGKLTAVDAAKSKLATSELLADVVDAGVQFHGGAGFMDEYPISRMYCDARGARIYAGTSEIMKLIISRSIFSDRLEPFVDRSAY
ncbi:acyl-CoA dehydrogenase family protein [Sphingobium aromaticiconvertens]|uniref:acyl-CoA dehydrogenase family protein n=1 Tax=Sphingobium aromaticiconvertens TaxID=365341 RepID=UPI00301650EE